MREAWSELVARIVGDGPSEMDPRRWTLGAWMLVSGNCPGMERQMDWRWTLGDGPSEVDSQSPDAGLRK